MTRPTSVSSLSEGQARYVLIDPALEKAGWKLNDRTQVGFEVPVDGYDAEPWNGVTDYCLFNGTGEVFAVIEAKRTCRSPREGEEQLRHYLTEIAKRQAFAPFGFLTNGLAWYFWDLGNANPRLIAGPFSPEDLAPRLAASLKTFLSMSSCRFPPYPSSSGLRGFWTRRTGCATSAATPSNSATPSSPPPSSNSSARRARTSLC